MCSQAISHLLHVIVGAVPAASVKLMYQPQPQPRQIQALSQFTVTKVACGQNHTLALTKEGQAFTWGKVYLLWLSDAKAKLVWWQSDAKAKLVWLQLVSRMSTMLLLHWHRAVRGRVLL